MAGVERNSLTHMKYAWNGGDGGLNDGLFEQGYIYSGWLVVAGQKAGVGVLGSPVSHLACLVLGVMFPLCYILGLFTMGYHLRD